MSNKIRFAQIYNNAKDEWWLQVALVYGLTSINTDWQCCEELEGSCLTPIVDLQYSLTRCVDEADAMLQLATHYANELKINQSSNPL
jgi:hypothetical protein